MRHCYAKRTASIQKEFQSMHTQRRLDFEVFKMFVAEGTNGYKHKYRILQAKTVNRVFRVLSAGKQINQHNTDLLQEILSVFGGPELQKEHEKLVNFEQQRDFVKLSLKVADTAKKQCTIVDFKICVLSTPNCFGSYYSRLENEIDVYNAVLTLSNGEHLRLLKRIVRHYCPQHRDLVESYSQRFQSSEQAPELSVHEVLEHQEKFTDLLIMVARDLNRSHSFLTDFLFVPLSETYPELQLAPIKENTASGILLALLPFCGYQNLHLLSKIVRKYCSDTTAQELDTFTSQWNDFAAKTTITAIYDTQLDKFPLRLSARGVSTITLHLQGEDWKDPTLSQTSQLAQFMADALKLKQWSVVPYRTILTGSETDAKGHCKVELLIPTVAACILMKEGASKTGPLAEMLKEKSITYIEVEEKIEDEDESKYHFTSKPESIATMYKQASKHTHLKSYFEQLELSTESLTPRSSPLLSAPPLLHQKKRKPSLHWQSLRHKRTRSYTRPHRSCPWPQSSPLLSVPPLLHPKNSLYRQSRRRKRTWPHTRGSHPQLHRSRPWSHKSHAKHSRSRPQPYRSHAKPYSQLYSSCAKNSRSHPQPQKIPFTATHRSRQLSRQSVIPLTVKSDRHQYSNNVQEKEVLPQ